MQDFERVYMQALRHAYDTEKQLAASAQAIAATAALALAVLVALIVAEVVAGLRRRSHGIPSPIEQLDQRA